MENKCKHERLELRGHERPEGLPEGCMYLTNLSLVCLDCGTHLMYTPDDLKQIVNIPHPPTEECNHSWNMISHPLSYWAYSTCLQCGKQFAPSAPTTKLVVSAGPLPEHITIKDDLDFPGRETPDSLLHVDMSGRMGITDPDTMVEIYKVDDSISISDVETIPLEFRIADADPMEYLECYSDHFEMNGIRCTDEEAIAFIKRVAKYYEDGGE